MSWVGKVVEVGVRVSVIPLMVNFTTELLVNPVPVTASKGLFVSPALSLAGEIVPRLNVLRLPSGNCQTLRPWVAASRVREA